MFKQRKEVVCCLSQVCILVNLGKRDRRWKPFDSDTVPSGLGGRDENFITPIVFQGRPDVVAISAVGSKGEPLIGSVVDDDSRAWDSEGSAIKIVVAKETRMSRQVGLPS